MQAAKYWRNKKLRYRLIMLERNGSARAGSAATGRDQNEREGKSLRRRAKVLA